MTTDPLDWIDDALRDWERRGLRRRLRVRSGPQTPVATWDGRELANFGSNDYLGLAAQPLVKAVRDVLSDVGWGSGASPLLTGFGSLQAELQLQLAQFEGAEAALLFSTGYAANCGTIAALVGPDDVILSDELNHASIIDGCRLSRAQVRIYAHADVDDLARGIEESQSARRRLIVTDSLFSMGGDFAPLDRIAELSQRAGAMLMVDEAHATGVFGPNGRGVCEMMGVEDAVHVRMGTFSKALGSIGGFVVGQQRLMEWLINRARPYFFSTALPQAAAAAALESLTIVRNEPFRRTRLLERAANLRKALRDQGWDLGNSESQIIPVIVGDPERAMALSRELLEEGMFVPAIRPPSVPEGKSLVRVSLTSSHSLQAIGQLVEALGRRTGFCPEG